MIHDRPPDRNGRTEIPASSRSHESQLASLRSAARIFEPRTGEYEHRRNAAAERFAAAENRERACRVAGDYASADIALLDAFAAQGEHELARQQQVDELIAAVRLCSGDASRRTILRDLLAPVLGEFDADSKRTVANLKVDNARLWLRVANLAESIEDLTERMTTAEDAILETAGGVA